MDTSRNSNLGDWFRSIIQSLKGVQEGFNSSTGQYGGGGIDEVNNKLEDVKTLLNNLRVDVKADDIDIGEINVDTTEIISKLDDISSVLINRLFYRLADKVTVVDHGTSDTTFALTPNVYHKWGTVPSLVLTLATPSDATALNEYMFQFACGNTITTLSLPSGVKWIGGTPVLEANTTYQVSIIDNIAVIGGA